MSVQQVRYYKMIAAAQRGHFLCHWRGKGYPTSKHEISSMINRTFDLWEFAEKMAKQKATGIVPNKLKGPEFKGFVNYTLTEADKAAFKVWECDDHDLWTVLAATLQSGYKLTSSYNPQNDTYSATLMCNDTESGNAGLVLSAFAPDPYNAIKTVIFKHTEILGEVWTEAAIKEQNSWG